MRNKGQLPIEVKACLANEDKGQLPSEVGTKAFKPPKFPFLSPSRP